MNIPGTQENRVARGKFVYLVVKAMFYRAACYVKQLVEIVRMIISVAFVRDLNEGVFFIYVGENIET